MRGGKAEHEPPGQWMLRAFPSYNAPELLLRAVAGGTAMNEEGGPLRSHSQGSRYTGEAVRVFECELPVTWWKSTGGECRDQEMP